MCICNTRTFIHSLYMYLNIIHVRTFIHSLYMYMYLNIIHVRTFIHSLYMYLNIIHVRTFIHSLYMYLNIIHVPYMYTCTCINSIPRHWTELQTFTLCRLRWYVEGVVVDRESCCVCVFTLFVTTGHFIHSSKKRVVGTTCISIQTIGQG